MNLRTIILTNNACFKAGRTIVPQGLMIHSTGANNPWLRRYVGPDDGLLGRNRHNNHWNQDRPGGRQVCVHAFIGRLADGSIATYQTLPWNHRGWHCGRGVRGSGNDTHISFELCEDNLMGAVYFKQVYDEAVELCVHLCKLYGLTEQNIISHSEGHRLGIASNHADVMHWFVRHAESMDSFRADVRNALTAPGYDIYTVVKGDSLWKIAAARLGSGARHPEIRALNGLTSEVLFPGQKLKIPK